MNNLCATITVAHMFQQAARRPEAFGGCAQRDQKLRVKLAGIIGMLLGFTEIK